MTTEQRPNVPKENEAKVVSTEELLETTKSKRPELKEEDEAKVTNSLEEFLDESN